MDGGGELMIKEVQDWLVLPDWMLTKDVVRILQQTARSSMDASKDDS